MSVNWTSGALHEQSLKRLCKNSFVLLESHVPIISFFFFFCEVNFFHWIDCLDLVKGTNAYRSVADPSLSLFFLYSTSLRTVSFFLYCLSLSYSQLNSYVCNLYIKFQANIYSKMKTFAYPSMVNNGYVYTVRKH